MKKTTLLLSLCLSSTILLAQQAQDALRYSFLNPTGTARFTSMGGAFGALGGDFSSISVNPAGLGVYTRSEFTFTPTFYYQGSESSFLGSSVNDDKYNFNIGNIGIVGSWLAANGEKTGWRSFSLGIGMNRTNNFHSNFTLEGFNSNSSLLNVYQAQAEGRAPDQLDAFGSNLAFQTYLIDTVPGSPTSYFNQVPNGGVRQIKTVNREGSMGETVIAFGANYENKLYLGGSVGITYARFSESSQHIEETVPDSGYALEEFYLNEEVRTRGNGFNIKFGAIYRVKEWLRIGGSIHSPTFWEMNDSWSGTMKAYYDTLYAPEYQMESPSGRFEYELTTPFRAVGSIALIVAKKGIISADYEYVDYSMARLNSGSYKFVDENRDIRNALTPSGNIRVGGELRLDPFALRAGAAFLGNPYRSGVNDLGTMNFSLGGGVRGEGYFIDVAYVLSKTSTDYYIYDRALVSPAKLDLNSNSIVLTIGFRY